MIKTKTPQRLAKMIAYILERRPDEFGLVPDREGYVKIKELLKALNEEKGWAHVRRFHLNEILYSIPNPPFEILDNRMRALEREHLPRPDAAPQLPKLLFTCVRKKAYPFVVHKGIFPSTYQQVVLSDRRDLAKRMGKRSDAQPVMLTVNVQNAIEDGVLFQRVGKLLFIAPFIPTGCFSGPPLPKDKLRTSKQAQPSETTPLKMRGGFPVNLDKVAQPDGTAAKTLKDETGWKGKRKHRKKHKRKRERPPWRK